MPFAFYRYRRVSDLERALTAPPLEAPMKRIFMVPGSGDRGLLDELLTPYAVTGGCRWQVKRWDELYRMLASQIGERRPKLQIDPPDHWLVLHGLLKEICADDSLNLPPGAKQRGFLRILGDQIRDLIREEVTPQQLFQCGENDDPLAQATVIAYERYLRALQEQNLTDSAGIATEARVMLKNSPRAAEVCRDLNLTLVGFYSLTHSQLELIRTLNGLGATITLYSPSADVHGEYGAAEQFDLDGNWISSKKPFHLLECRSGDPRQEMETAARLLVLWENGSGPLSVTPWPGWDAIGITVPSARMSEAREVFYRYHLPVSWQAGQPLTQTPLWNLTDQCLLASQGWGTEATLRLLSEPWLCGTTIDAPALRQHYPRGAERWRSQLKGKQLQAFEDCVSLAQSAQRGGTALELLTALQKFLTGRTCAVSASIAALPSLDGEVRTLSDSCRELDRKIVQIRETVRDLGRWGEQQLSGGDAMAFLKAWAEGTSIRDSESQSDTMTVFADAPPVLFHRPVWLMLGAESGVWPGSLAESPLLSDSQKEKLHSLDPTLDVTHLPSLSEQRKQREILFRRLIACGDELTIVSSPSRDEQDRPVEVTGLLPAAEDCGWVCRSGKTLTRDLDDLLTAPGQPRLIPVEGRQPSPWAHFPEERALPTNCGIAITHVVYSSVDDFGDCPYRFMLSHGLKYQPAPIHGEFNAQLAGNAVHRLWEQVWRCRAAGQNRSLLEQSRAMRDQVFESEYAALLHLPSLRRHRFRLWAQIDRCAELQTRLEEAIGSHRTGITCEGTLPEMTINGTTFTGRFDRMDNLDDGRVLLWDYKSGKADTFKAKQQLACYALALAQNTPPIQAAGFGYLCLGDGSFVGSWDSKWQAAFAKKTKKTLSERLDEAQTLLNSIASAAKNRSYPPNYDSRACSNCPFAELCRRGELNGREEEDQEDSDVEEEAEE